MQFENNVLICLIKSRPIKQTYDVVHFYVRRMATVETFGTWGLKVVPPQVTKFTHNGYTNACGASLRRNIYLRRFEGFGLI